MKKYVKRSIYIILLIAIIIIISILVIMNKRNNERYKMEIVCWGDSLTAGGGWTTILQELSGLEVYNAGTGGEDSRTIMARQGADLMVVNNITIPKDKIPVTIANFNDDGFDTLSKNKVKPLLQGGYEHVNPVRIGDIEGNIEWTGQYYNDKNGTWTFTRLEEGKEVVITEPTTITTNYDRNHNSPYLMIIFMGQNGGYSSNEDLINQHKLMIEHANAKNVIILGLSSGSRAGREEYESVMKKEFGKYFISLREYLSCPIYNEEQEIISCNGLAEQCLEPNNTYTYNGITYDAIEEIKNGIVPHMILRDSVHYTEGTKRVIGDMLYKKCCELGIF